MAIYAYYRVSTQSQVEKNSTAMQKAVVEKYCQDNGIVIDQCFSDEGISGAMNYSDDDITREGVVTLLSKLNPGDKIIVQNTSRLWRSDMAKAMILHKVTKAKAYVISVEQPTYDIYSKDPNNILLNGIMELLDQYEKLSIAMKLAKGRRTKADKGCKPCGIAPYGYRWERGNIVADNDSTQVVKDIFARYIEFGSLSKLKSYCDSRGYRSSRGREFTRMALKNIINNDFYIGVITYDGKKTKGAHPVFLDESLYEQANAILKR